MQTNPESNQKIESQEENTELLDKLHNTGVFGRSEYAKRDFWNDRFKESNGFFDWYLDWEDLKTYLEKTYPIKKDSKILMVGCGNARLSEKMYRDGYQNIVNIDISDVVIDKMKEYHKEKNMEMEFLVMDATAMTFPDETFDVIIDKGTLDAIMCGKISEPTQKLLKEMARVSKVGGEIFIVSHGQPVHRRELFVATLGKEKYKYLFSKQQLSSLAQLINIFRSKLKDKPISHIFKDKELLEESLREYKEVQQLSLLKRLLLKKKEIDEAKKKLMEENNHESNQESQQPIENKNKVNDSDTNTNTIDTQASEVTTSDYLEIKKDASKPDELKSPNIENKQEETKVDSKEIKISDEFTNPFKTNNETDSQDIISQPRTELTSIANNQNEPENRESKIEDDKKSDTSSTKDNTNEESDIKAEYNPQRQSYCFIYYIKKLST